MSEFKIIVDSKLLKTVIPEFMGDLEEYVDISYKDGYLLIGDLKHFPVHSQQRSDWRVSVKCSKILRLRKMHDRFGHQPLTIELSTSNVIVTLVV